MAKYIFETVNLKLFDGEPGDGQVAQQIPGLDLQDESGASTEPQVIYGRVEDAVDPNTQIQQKPPETPVEEKPFKVYRNKEEWQTEFDSIMGKRLKDHRELSQKVTTYEPVVQKLMKFHNVSSMDELSKFVETKVMEDLAYNAGMPVEMYKQLEDTKAENARLKQQMDARTHDETMEKVFSEAARLKGTAENPGLYPDLDIKKLLSGNEEFVNLLAAGFSVEKAYKAINIDNLLKNAGIEAAKAAEKNVLTDIRSRGARIPENGTRQSPNVIVKDDPSKWSNEDWDNVYAKLRRGEQIKL